MERNLLCDAKDIRSGCNCIRYTVFDFIVCFKSYGVYTTLSKDTGNIVDNVGEDDLRFLMKCKKPALGGFCITD